uniref:protein-serine/threonine phosphatase n=1 Tax=Geotrypetes seraphini TaxID=260995 RepID=A0A6P8P5T7_GEOSA|nr:protein phosphatase Slingshot homolog 3 isoform X2 [Geotrypetes seraphini]
MALITVHRSPSGSPHGTPAALKDEERVRRSRMQRRHSFVMVKGAALLLQEEEEPDSIQNIPPSSLSHKRTKSAQAQDQQQRCHLQAMVGLLRSQDNIRLAVRLESARTYRIRYLMVVSTLGSCDEDETILLGVNFPSDGCNRCTIGMVLPLWSNTQVFLDGDGGFSVTSAGETRIFKPISVQTMWSMMQVLHKACESAFLNNHFPGGSALAWAQFYENAIASDQSCINEWQAMSDLESVRPDSPALFSDQPTEGELTERMIKAKLREIMMTKDLENITSKEIRNELEQHTNCNLKDYKEFIDNEMMLILAQMDRPSRIFDYLYLGSEWNASNLEELLRNGKLHSKVLVHCKMGVSRSASTVIAYAMKQYGWTLEEALRYVKEKRPIVHPNPGFMKQLLIYQGILDASKQRHSHLWERKIDYNQLESPGDVTDRVIKQLEDDLQTEGTIWYDQPSPEEEEDEEEEDEEEEDESLESPPYCFQPLKDVLEELDSFTESSENVPDVSLIFSQGPPNSPSPVDVRIQGPDEMGSNSDDSLAEEVSGHLSSPKLRESQVPSKLSLSVPTPVTPRRHRINLWSVMRSISEMESQEDTPPSPAAAAKDPGNAGRAGEEAEVFGSLPRRAPEIMSCSHSEGHPGMLGSCGRREQIPGLGASKRSTKKRLPRQPRAVAENGMQSHEQPGLEVEPKLTKQKSYQPETGKVRKVLETLQKPPEGSEDKELRQGDSTEEEVELVSRPRLLHLQSVAELKAAALVSRQAKAFERMLSPPAEGDKREVGEDGKSEGEPESGKELYGMREGRLGKGKNWSSEGELESESRQKVKAEGEPRSEREQNGRNESEPREERDTGQNERETVPSKMGEEEPEGGGEMEQNRSGKGEPFRGKELRWNKDSREWAPLQLTGLAEEQERVTSLMQAAPASSVALVLRPESIMGVTGSREADLALDKSSPSRLERTVSGGRRMVRQDHVDAVEPFDVLAQDHGPSASCPAQDEGDL